MKRIVNGLHFQALGEEIRRCGDGTIELCGVCGQRYIGTAVRNKRIRITGTPGNALGAYLDGGTIEVFGNAQDATGDTMNDGVIKIHGSAGDATGYAMRGGKIFIEGDTGYRAGVHMKAYEGKAPAIVVGGRAGSFLGEYQAGGVIVVLGLDSTDSGEAPVGYFCGTGMHGGRIYLRSAALPRSLPEQVCAERCTDADFAAVRPLLDEFSAAFGRKETFSPEEFYVLSPNTKNPYKKLYTLSGG